MCKLVINNNKVDTVLPWTTANCLPDSPTAQSKAVTTHCLRLYTKALSPYPET